MTREYDWRAAIDREADLVPAAFLVNLLYALTHDGEPDVPSDGREQAGEVSPRVFAALGQAIRDNGYEPSLEDTGDEKLLGRTGQNVVGELTREAMDELVNESPVFERYVKVTTGLTPASTLRVGLHEFGHVLLRHTLTLQDLALLGYLMFHVGEDGAEEAMVQLAADAVMGRLGFELSEYGPAFISLKSIRTRGEIDDEIREMAAGLAEAEWEALLSADEEAWLR